MVTVYKHKNERTKRIVSLVLFILLLLLVGPACYFNGINYVISVATNKFINIMINLAPLLAYISLGYFLMYYYYLLFIKRRKLTFSIVSISIFGIFLVGSTIFYCINGAYLFNNIRYYLYKDYYDKDFLLGFIFLIIGIILFIIEIVGFFKKKKSIAMIVSENNVVKINRHYSVFYILFTMLFLYLLDSFFVLLIINIGFNIESVFVILAIFINLFNYCMSLYVYKNNINNLSKVCIVLLNALVLVFFAALELSNDSFLIHYIKPICPLDYAISFPVLPLLVLINMIALTTFICLPKKENKLEII